MNAEIKELSGGKVIVGRNVTLRGSIQASENSVITIGDNVVMNRTCVLRAAEGADITIGGGCLLSDVHIYSSDLHSVIDVDTGQRLNPAKPVLIEERVWLSSGVIVLPGVIIGHDSIIGARSVVTKDVPPNSLAVGTPAAVARSGVRWSRTRI